MNLDDENKNINNRVTNKENNGLTKLHDSGQREIYQSGAQRDNRFGKGRFDLIPFQAIMRLARHYEAGGQKYTDRNWEKGMFISRYLDAALRHLSEYNAGFNNEDHLAAALWNVCAIMHHEKYLPDMQDIPSWNERKSNWIVGEFLD